MKKRTVVLCELCEEDRLAATIVHWGLCGEHVATLSKTIDGQTRRGGSSERQATIQPNKGKVRRAYTKHKHEKCGQMIDPRGWKQHIKACKGQGKTRGV